MEGRKLKIGTVSLFISLIVSLTGTAFAVNLDRSIEEIRIEGVERAERSTVEYYIGLQKGSKYSAEIVRNDIRRLFKLGFFQDIIIDVSEVTYGLVVTYRFTEKPFVRKVSFSGNEEQKDDELEMMVRAKRGDFFSEGFLPWDKLRIKQSYRNKGFYFTEVETKVIPLPDNRVDVVYTVTEGKKITVTGIRFEGASVFSQKELEGAIETSDEGIFSFLSDSGAYKRDTLKTDVLRLESYYHDHGHIDVKVGEPSVEIDKEQRGIIVSFTVEEGPQYHLGAIDIQGDDVYTAEELRAIIKSQPGNVFNRSKFRQDIFMLTDLYSQKGYAFARVSPSIDKNGEELTVSTAISVEKGRRVYVGKITISGNEETRDSVIRRQFMLSEGELFNSERLRASRMRIQRLGFFESVEIQQRSRTERDLINIDVQVVERSTGELSFALGYSSLEHLLAQGSIRWKNLFGRGQELSATVDYSELRNDYSLSFTDPAIFQRQLLGGIDIYNKSYKFSAYESRRTGFSLRLGREVLEDLWLKVGYKLEETTIVLDEDEEEEASAYLREQEGTSSSGSIFPSLTYDLRNDRYNPSKGYRLHTFFERSGLGGEERFYKIILEGSYYEPLYAGFVGMVHMKGGLVEGFDGREVPITHRFFLGGPTSLRGFNLEDIGPQDINGDSIGGEAMLLLNVELQYRFTDFFRGFLFYDRGNVYGSHDEANNTTDQYFDISNMRDAVGIGIHFFTPMGPMTMAYGFKLDPREGEAPSEFHFTIGGAF